jgi:hypothetical protein
MLYGEILRVQDICNIIMSAQLLFQHLQQHDGKLGAVDDFIYGHNYLDAVIQGHINKNDMVLMISMDGAQLYRSKISDCWINTWVILNITLAAATRNSMFSPVEKFLDPKTPKISTCSCFQVSITSHHYSMKVFAFGMLP